MEMEVKGEVKGRVGAKCHLPLFQVDAFAARSFEGNPAGKKSVHREKAGECRSRKRVTRVDEKLAVE